MHDLVARIADRSGLQPETCLNLLEEGWTYHEVDGMPDTWMSPEASLRL